MNTIKIEAITSATVLNPCAEILVEVYKTEPWNDQWTRETATERLEDIYLSPKFIGFVAVEGEKVIGCCVGNIEAYFGTHHFVLQELFVSCHAQRNGVGTMLMNRLKKHLESCDIKSVIALASRKKFSYDFYKKDGFNALEDVCLMHYGAMKKNTTLDTEEEIGVGKLLVKR